jgi:hypothetical protein
MRARILVKNFPVAAMVVWSAAAAAQTAAPATPRSSTAAKKPAPVVTMVDHLVYAVPDLDSGSAQVEKLLGVKPMVGGQHPGRGTRNALVGLGPTAYLEILAPDPAQPAPKKPRSFHLDDVKSPRLVGWGAHVKDLDAVVKDAAAKGIQLGDLGKGGRKRPDGVELSWRFTDPDALLGGGIVPFFIDWGESPHPAKTAPQGATLVALRAEHPDPGTVERILRVLHVEMPVTRGPAPALIAVIETANGRVELH